MYIQFVGYFDSRAIHYADGAGGGKLACGSDSRLVYLADRPFLARRVPPSWKHPDPTNRYVLSHIYTTGRAQLTSAAVSDL
jgi:hypothetical protein